MHFKHNKQTVHALIPKGEREEEDMRASERELVMVSESNAKQNRIEESR